MALSIKGDWLSWINLLPSFPPNEGFFTINQDPDPATGAFDGTHHHPGGDFDITGKYTPATTVPPVRDHIEFSGTQAKTKCTFTYRGDIVTIGGDLIIM